jgi:DUF3052 family protein
VTTVKKARPATSVSVNPVAAGYSGTPLPKKLGIKPGSVVRLIGAPRSFRKTLGELPEGAVLRENDGEAAVLTLWFLPSQRELDRGIHEIAARLERGSLWMIWPKKSSGMDTDLTQREVREAGLAAGLVDYKVCAVDATWSGLLFTRRRGTK